MNLWTILASAAVTVATLGLALSVKGLWRAMQAQRDWKVASARLTAEQVRQLDLRVARTQADDGRTLNERRAAELTAMIRQLMEQKALSHESASILASALRQPSEIGRREYAEKLARQAVQSRRLVAH